MLAATPFDFESLGTVVRKLESGDDEEESKLLWCVVYRIEGDENLRERDLMEFANLQDPNTDALRFDS